MLNTSVIMGRLVADPELRKTNSGKSVMSFTVAVDRGYSRQGEEKQTDYIDCVAWEKTADFISRFFRKGSMIAVQGRIQTRNYEDKNGNKRKAVEIVADNVSFCGDKKQQDDSKIREAAQPAYTGNADVNDFREITSDDDLPF